MPVPVPLKSSTNVGDEQRNKYDTANVSNDSNPRQNYSQSRLPPTPEGQDVRYEYSLLL